jgi:hypothetical protein
VIDLKVIVKLLNRILIEITVVLLHVFDDEVRLASQLLFVGGSHEPVGAIGLEALSLTSSPMILIKVFM